MTLYAGQKVTLKRSPPASLVALHSDKAFPVFSEVYTVRCVRDVSGLSVLLVEIKNPVVDCGKCGMLEQAFCADAFRPVVEKGTDKGVALLKEIVEGNRHPVSTRHPEGVV